MGFLLYDNKHSDFIEDLLQNKNIHNQLSSLVLKTQEQNSKKKDINEILQVIEFQFYGHDAWLLTSNNRIFLVLRNTRIKALSFLETAIRSEFSEDEIKIDLSVPLNTGYKKFCDTLKSAIPENDNKSNTSLRRFERSTKTFIVHSTNPLVRQELTQILQSFGNVIGTSTHYDFIKNYQDYAPNAVFINSKDYLQNTGLSIASIKNSIDAHPKYVLIDSEFCKNTVNSFLKEGVSGLLLHPTSFRPVFLHLIRLKVITKSSQYGGYASA